MIIFFPSLYFNIFFCIFIKYQVLDAFMSRCNKSFLRMVIGQVFRYALYAYNKQFQRPCVIMFSSVVRDSCSHQSRRLFSALFSTADTLTQCQILSSLAVQRPTVPYQTSQINIT